MKLITLNTWAGMAGLEGLLAFIKTHKDTDVFCLQEIWDGGLEAKEKMAAGRSLKSVEIRLLQKLKDALPHHTVFFTPQYVEYYGIAMFINTEVSVREEGTACVYREPGYISPSDLADHARILQYVTLDTATGPVTIMNVHGAWQPVGKIDTPERREQSRRIVELCTSFSHPVALCGDFNLEPDTESMAMLEAAGLGNLVKEYGVTSTRTGLYTKPGKFADYVMVSKGIKVNDFRVLPDEVSDHAPLMLDFDL